MTTTTTVAGRRTSSAILWLIIALFAKQGFVYGEGEQQSPLLPQELQIQPLPTPQQQQVNLQHQLNPQLNPQQLNQLQQHPQQHPQQHSQQYPQQQSQQQQQQQQQPHFQQQQNPPQQTNLPQQINPPQQTNLPQQINPPQQTNSQHLPNPQHQPNPQQLLNSQQQLPNAIDPINSLANGVQSSVDRINSQNGQSASTSLKPNPTTAQQQTSVLPQLNNNPPSMQVGGSQPSIQGIIPTSIPGNSHTQMHQNFNPSDQPDQNFTPGIIYNSPTLPNHQQQYQQQQQQYPQLQQYPQKQSALMPVQPMSNYPSFNNNIPPINGQSFSGPPLNDYQTPYYTQNSPIDGTNIQNQISSTSYPTQGSYNPTSNAGNNMGWRQPSQKFSNLANLIPFDMNAMTYVQQPLNIMNDITDQAMQLGNNVKTALGGMMLQKSQNLLNGGQSMMNNVLNIPKKVIDIKRDFIESIANIWGIPSVSENNGGQSNMQMTSQLQNAYGQPQISNQQQPQTSYQQQPQTSYQQQPQTSNQQQPQITYSSRNIETMPEIPNPINPPQKIMNYMQGGAQYPFN